MKGDENTPKRNYLLKTVKILFGLSGGQCAHPDCTTTLVEPATEESGAVVSGELCHIHAISQGGPRGTSGLTEQELNTPENLILLCPHHHTVVDGQPQTFPAETLKDWKKTHEEKVQKRLAESDDVVPDLLVQPHFPTNIIDKTIDDEIDTLCKSRRFAEFDLVRSARILGQKVVDGELSAGSDINRARALAWCARLLSASGELREAEDFLGSAERLSDCPEIAIAQAFITSRRDGASAALSALANISSPMARSAALMVVTNRDGARGAVDWLEAAGLSPKDLDPDGKLYLLLQQLELDDWDAAKRTAEALTDSDYIEAPALHQASALTSLQEAVPPEFRSLVLGQPPFDAVVFPLASDEAAINARREAHAHFSTAALAARELDCPKSAELADRYALWLELRDAERSQAGKQKLESMLRVPKTALPLVPLGMQFGIQLDLGAVEQEIERQEALHGAGTQDTAIARLALAFTQKTPADVANYVSRHEAELAKFINRKWMMCFQIEMLSRAGHLERANECLERLLKDGLTDYEEGRLRRMIAEAEGKDPVAARIAQFKRSNSLSDLHPLVEELQSRKEWERLCEYGEVLFARTRSLRDAELLALAMNNTHRTEQLLELLESNAALLKQSATLQLHYCWSLFAGGHLLRARTELNKLSHDSENPDYRALQLQLGIALGDWNALAATVVYEHANRDRRSAHELILTAQLALHVRSPLAKELTLAAAAKGSDDASVLAAAYFLASSSGWEDDTQSIQWLNKAAALSEEEGPIQRVTLEEVLDRKPEWDRRESETARLLIHGDVPLFVAAESLNRTLIDLWLYPAFTNLLEHDPRRRAVIPAYSGKRSPVHLAFSETVCIDATALLTLSFLGMLETALNAFKKILLPHSTLSWLFGEKQKVAFHQPSRIRGAHQVRELLATDVLERFTPSTLPDSDLSAQVGVELAHMIGEAETAEGAHPQRIVVRPSPVHRVASLMKEEADLTKHAAVLSSCLSVVESLRQKGQLTVEELKKSRDYLALHEKPWPQQPEITDGAVLYLDDLAVTYLIHLGLLGKLAAAGFKMVVSARLLSETNSLLAYEGIAEKIKDEIERIRAALHLRIESGKILVGRRNIAFVSKDQGHPDHPTLGVLALAGECGAVISDDRFLNRHANVDEGGVRTPICSTLDCLDALVSAGLVTKEERFERRTRLRRAGYFFVPLAIDEFEFHLAAAKLDGTKVIETAELRAVRESILRVRMTDWLQLPSEGAWLDETFRTLLSTLRSSWKEGADLAEAAAHSDWILDLLDTRGWAHRIQEPNAAMLAATGRTTNVLMLLTPPSDAPTAIRQAYWEWAESRFLTSIKEKHPEQYAWITDWYKARISTLSDAEFEQGETDDE